MPENKNLIRAGFWWRRFFASVLYDAMEGIGTNEDVRDTQNFDTSVVSHPHAVFASHMCFPSYEQVLIRVICSQKETNLKAIAEVCFFFCLSPFFLVILSFPDVSRNVPKNPESKCNI